MRSVLITLLAILLLFSCQPGKKTITGIDPEKLNGSWVLNYISYPGDNMDSLYPNKKPEINLNTDDKRVTGNTGCNSFSGPFRQQDNKISFEETMAMTRMFCPGKGETAFLETLKKVNSFSVDGKTLNFIMGDIAIMRFNRK